MMNKTLTPLFGCLVLVLLVVYNNAKIDLVAAQAEKERLQLECYEILRGDEVNLHKDAVTLEVLTTTWEDKHRTETLMGYVTLQGSYEDRRIRHLKNVRKMNFDQVAPSGKELLKVDLPSFPAKID